MVGYIDNETQSPSDYFVTKTEFISNRTGDDGLRLDYDYQIFSNNKHVNQLIYKNYFLPPGFYLSEYQVEQGFWHKRYLEEEIYLYSYNGLIRDGEHVDTAYYDTTDIAIYLVEKTFNVEKSEVIVPASRVSSTFNNDGSYTCLRDNSIVSSVEECPQADTTFTDCFKVTQITNMTMMGSGVEYGHKVYTWLAKGHGIVKSDMYLRWTEDPFSESSAVGEIDEFGQVWTGFSRIELAKFDIEKTGNVFRQIYNPAHIIKIDDFSNLSDFDFDSMKVSHQTGFHTIKFEEVQQ